MPIGNMTYMPNCIGQRPSSADAGSMFHNGLTLKTSRFNPAIVAKYLSVVCGAGWDAPKRVKKDGVKHATAKSWRAVMHRRFL